LEHTFSWKKPLEESDTIQLSGNTYQVHAVKIFDSYRVDLLENGMSVVLENSSNDSFKACVDPKNPIADQIVEWAGVVLQTHHGECDKCGLKRIRISITKSEKRGKHLRSYNFLCKSCRENAYNLIFADLRTKRERMDKKIRKELSANPPVIVGGFQRRIEAYRIIRSVPEPTIYDFGDGFLSAKAIVQAKDGTFYPAFCSIDKSSGGELWGVEYIRQGSSDTVSDSFIFPYINKPEDEMYPIEYETLQTIEDDFHQKTWFGSITEQSIRHHYSNQIKVKWSGEVDPALPRSEAAHVTVRTYFSVQHLLSCRSFIDEVEELESALDRAYSDEVFVRHRSLCTAYVFSAAAFLEASINELFMDSDENKERLSLDLNENEVERLSSFWKRGIPRTASYTILEKYQIALTILDRQPLYQGTEPCQSISMILKLRNSLVHYEPEWVTTKSNQESEIKSGKFEGYFRGRFAFNRFTGADNPFFPDKCLSIGLMKWIHQNILSFSDVFYDRLSTIPPYEKVRHKAEL
jgi:hypothetical protein